MVKRFDFRNIFRTKYLFTGLLVCVLGLPTGMWLLPQSLNWILYAVSGVAFLLLLFLWRGVLSPAQTTIKGMELIGAQDFNNRLREVNEPESDRIVTLFNRMIDKLREERLRNREQEGFLKQLVEASPMGVVMLDLDGKIRMMNPSFLRITGIRTPGEGLGKEVLELPSELARKMADVPLGKNLEIRMGDARMFRCYHLSFPRMGFQSRFFLLESLTEEVMKAERSAYEKVIRIMSHEVNNTMGGVRSVLETIHDICDDEELREVVESCDIRCSQMCNFINSYADVVRIPHPVMVATDLNYELRKIVPFLQEITGEGVLLRFSPVAGKLDVRIDVTQIQQVVVNIVKNARESIVSGNGFVELATEMNEGTVSMEVSNNGEPIPEDVSRNLFSPFFTTKREGRGLGLTLTSEILNRHGASFSLRTGRDGITRFRIGFPT